VLTFSKLIIIIFHPFNHAQTVGIFPVIWAFSSKF